MEARIVVALTGSTGFIGSTILKQLSSHGYTVRTLVRNSHTNFKQASSNIEIIHGGLDNDSALSKLTAGAHFIIHCAGRVRGRNYSDFKTDNVDGTQNLVTHALNSAQLKNFIHISSLAAREPQLSHYAKSKHTGELLFSKLGFNKWTIIRPPAVYGPNDTELKPLFDWTRRGILWVPGNPQQRFSLLHVEDLSQLILVLIESNSHQQSILEPNDGYKIGYTWRNIQEITSNYFNRKVRSIPLPRHMLTTTAHMNMVFSKLMNYSPMLSPGKVRELVHDDWTTSSSESISSWSPALDLKSGLSTLYSQY